MLTNAVQNVRQREEQMRAGATLVPDDEYMRAIYGPDVAPAAILAGNVAPPAQVTIPSLPSYL